MYHTFNTYMFFTIYSKLGGVMKPNKKANQMTVKELAAYIDQSVLKPEFTQ